MARGRSNGDGTAHSYWIKTLHEARNHAREAITSAEAWGLSPELSVGPVDVEDMSKPQKIMAQAHSYTLEYYDHLSPWRQRHSDLWEEKIWSGRMPTGEFEEHETQKKHLGAEVLAEPELDEKSLKLENVPAWRMRIVTHHNGADVSRYKLYLPPGACWAIYNQLMSVQNQLDIAADVGPIIPSDEEVGVLTHDDVDYSDYEEVNDDYGMSES